MVLFYILTFVFLAVGILVWISERNPTHLTPEQHAKLGKWMIILMSLIMLTSAIKYFF